jgi:hypothetical protein
MAAFRGKTRVRPPALETRPVSRLPFQKRCSGNLQMSLKDGVTAISSDLQIMRKLLK